MEGTSEDLANVHSAADTAMRGQRAAGFSPRGAGGIASDTNYLMAPAP